MSTRRAARTIDERVAAIEEFVRRLQGDTAVTPTDTRFLYSATGDILVAVAQNDPQPVAIGALGDVLTVGPGSQPVWVDPDRVQQSLYVAKGVIVAGTGPSTVAAVPPGPNGTVLTADSSALAGVAWM